MTEHTVTVEETVEQEETVYTCDYCGLGDEDGEMLEYTVDEGMVPSLFNASVDGHETIPDLHYHTSCVPEIVNSDEQADAITLKSQYDRRTGDSLLIVVTSASLLFWAIGGALVWYGVSNTGLLASIGTVFGVLWLLGTLALSRWEAKNTIKEFST